MSALRQKRILIFALSLLVFSLGRGVADDPAKDRKEILALIDQLAQVKDPDLGYSPTVSGESFLPLYHASAAAALLFQKPAVASDPLRHLVKEGVQALPHLIAHLDDKRETAIKIRHPGAGKLNRLGGLWLDEEFDHNPRTDKRDKEDREPTREEPKDLTYTVTVGDLCFVAIGQIVNRRFQAVRYQPTLIIIVNSPTRSAALREQVKRAWGKLTREEHRKSLVADFLTPDNDERRIGACQRLAYYYPDALEPVALEFLTQRFADAREVEEFVREKLYKATDLKRARSLFDSFVARHGPASRDVIAGQLLDDLSLLEADEARRLNVPLTEFHEQPRILLVQLLNFPKDVWSKDRPRDEPVTEAVQARLIAEGLIYDASEKIDRAVRDLMLATKDDGLARACTKRLVGRGYDSEIESYCHRRLSEVTKVVEKEQWQAILARIGWTPLHVAADRGDSETALRLLNGRAQVNVTAHNGRTPLHVAALAGHGEMVGLLVKRGARVMVPDADERTPLHLAALEGYAETVKLLLDYKADVTVKDKSGSTPLDLARSMNHKAVTELLTHQGSKP